MSSKKIIPDFLIIGAGKSGTTSLDKYLSQHPQIFMSPLKEPNFFAYEHVDPESLKWNRDSYEHYMQSVRTYDKYAELFNGAGTDDILGETSNTYLYIKGTAENIKKYNPDIKLIAVLRQPVERLYSRFLHLARDNRLPSENFEDVLDTSSIWWKRNDLVKEGFYYTNLKRYYDNFNNDQIKVILYEDFKNSSAKVLGEICDFLNIQKDVHIDTSVQFNKSGFVKNKIYDRFLGHNSLIKKAVRSTVPGFYGTLKNIKAFQKVNNDLQNKNLYQPKLNPDLKTEIYNNIYKKEIEQLEVLTGKNLSHWCS